MKCNRITWLSLSYFTLDSLMKLMVFLKCEGENWSRPCPVITTNIYGSGPWIKNEREMGLYKLYMECFASLDFLSLRAEQWLFPWRFLKFRPTLLAYLLAALNQEVRYERADIHTYMNTRCFHRPNLPKERQGFIQRSYIHWCVSLTFNFHSSPFSFWNSGSGRKCASDCLSFSAAN